MEGQLAKTTRKQESLEKECKLRNLKVFNLNQPDRETPETLEAAVKQNITAKAHSELFPFF